MKKIIFFLTLVFVSNNVFFSQNISGEVEYEISSWECKYCRLPGKKKVVKSILKVSDYRYLHQLFFAAEKEEGKFGCVEYSWNHCSLSTNVNQVHSIIEIDIPVTEKKSFMNISKSENKIPYLSENDLFRLSQVSQKINSEYTKWKKICDEEQAKKQSEKVKAQKEIEIAKQVKIEEQRLQYQPKLDSLINENKFKEAATYIFQIQKNIESDIYWDFRKYYTVKIYSYFIIFLDNNQFQLFDEEFQKLRKNSIYNICNDSLLDKRIFKEKDFEINKIKAKTISSEEILLVGDWSFVSINGYVMRIILNADRTFILSNKFKLEMSYCDYENNIFELNLGNDNELKGYWKLNNGRIEIIPSEQYSYSSWKKTKQIKRFFQIIQFKKNKLFINEQMPDCHKRGIHDANHYYQQSFLIEYKGKRNKEK